MQTKMKTINKKQKLKKEKSILQNKDEKLEIKTKNQKRKLNMKKK